MGRRIDIARGFESAGRLVDVAYATSALTISRSSSRDVGCRWEVADCTTRVEMCAMIEGRRCRARCWSTGEGVGAELVDDGIGRNEAASRVEEQWIAVRPTWTIS